MLLNLLTCWYGVRNTAISSYYFTSTLGAHMGDKRTVCTVLVGKPEGKRLFGRSGYRWKDTNHDFCERIRMGGYGLEQSVSG